MNTDEIIEEFELEFVKRNASKENKAGKSLMLGKNYVAFINHLRNMSGLIQTLSDELPHADIRQLWIEYTSGDDGCRRKVNVYHYSPTHYNSCIHVVLIMSDSESELNYATHISNRYLNAYMNIRNVDIRKRSKQVAVKEKVEQVQERTIKKSFAKRVLEQLLLKLSSFL